MNRNKINDKDYNLSFDACHIGNVKLIKAVCDYDNIIRMSKVIHFFLLPA